MIENWYWLSGLNVFLAIVCFAMWHFAQKACERAQEAARMADAAVEALLEKLDEDAEPSEIPGP